MRGSGGVRGNPSLVAECSSCNAPLSQASRSSRRRRREEIAGRFRTYRTGPNRTVKTVASPVNTFCQNSALPLGAPCSCRSNR